jgi:hypothetical protein
MKIMLDRERSHQVQSLPFELPNPGPWAMFPMMIPMVSHHVVTFDWCIYRLRERQKKKNQRRNTSSISERKTTAVTGPAVESEHFPSTLLLFAKVLG